MTTLADLRGDARLRLDDGVVPYLWSDAELDAWINEAIREASLRAGLNRQKIEIDITAAESECTLGESIVYVHRARLVSGNRVLDRTSRDDLDSCRTGWEAATGSPRAFFIEGNTLTLYPTPIAADTLELRAECYPDLLEADSDEVAFESHDVWPLLEWVIYRAAQKRDADSILPNPDQYDSAFTRRFGPRPSARTRRGWQEYGGTSTARIPA